MDNKRKTRATARLSMRIMRRGAMIVVFSLIVGIILSCTILWPSLQKSTAQEASQFAINISRIINATLNGFSQNSRFIVEHYGLWGALDSWYKDPSEEKYKEVSIQLEHIERITEIMRCVIIEDKEGMRFFSGVGPLPEDLTVLELQQYSVVLNDAVESCWVDYYKSDTQSSGTLAYIFNGELASRHFTITMYFKADALISDINDISKGVFSGYAIVTENTLISQWQDGETENIKLKGLTINDSISHDGTGYYFKENIASSGWDFVGFIAMSDFNSLFISIFVISICIYFFVSLGTYILISITVDRTIAPIKELGDTMKRVSLGDLDVRSNIKTDDEISELSEIFNKMIEELRNDIDAKIKYESDMQAMKYNLLTAQIGSHAIYNTTSAINSLVRLGRYDDVIKANSALAEILRNTLRIDDISAKDALRQEIIVTNCFWELEKLRVENNARLIWDVQEELMDLQVQKGLIQPLVENSIHHGLKDDDTGEINGTITVSVRADENDIYITVEDDGKGIPEEILERLNMPAVVAPSDSERGLHIGLANIKLRLSYIYGRPDCVKIISNDGTKVTLTIPRKHDFS